MILLSTKKRFVFDEREFSQNAVNCDDCEHYDAENDVCLLEECCYFLPEPKQRIC